MMNFILKPSLEHVALVQVAATLWNTHDVRTLVEKYALSQSFDNFSKTPNEVKEIWKHIEKTVTGKVSQLEIPTSLKEKMLCYIQPVGIEILKWIEYHHKCCSLDVGLPTMFCWTPQGTIDKKKTAEMLLKDDTLNITIRYELACTYCLEDDISELWIKIRESYNLSFYNDGIFFNVPCSQELLQKFWWKYVERKAACGYRVSFSDPYYFQCAAEAGNKTATEYFLQNLMEREELLLKTALVVVQKCDYLRGRTNPSKQYYSEVLCFLLSQMNEKQQVQIFKEHPIQMSKCLLDWPWQNLFVEIVSCLWSFLPDQLYCSLLLIIIVKLRVGCKDYNYHKLFRYVWQQIPHSFKSDIINDGNFYNAFDLLLLINDREIIKLIFQDTSIAGKQKFITSDRWKCLCKYLIYQEEWDLLKFCVPLCTSSKDEMVKFKKKFKKHIQREKIPKYLLSKNGFEMNENKLEEFFRFLDDIVHSYDKRKSLEEGNRSQDERFVNNKFKK